MTLREATELVDDIIDEVETVVIADRDFLENVVLGILSQGHVLLEDVPGTGKTLTANAFATVLNLSFSRVQFTPDLLPKDVLGTNVFNENDGTFEFQEGPIFGNVILGDEINRAPPKTQAAMLETMAERQVTVEGETRQLPEPFFVIATQNPVGQEGTFPLPEAQVDRFLVKDTLGQPDREGKVELLQRRADRFQSIPEARPLIDDPELILELQRVPETIRVHDDLLGYMAEIVERSHDDHRTHVGVSPRGLQRLFEASRARAVIEGREYVVPGDIQRIAEPVLSHRLVLSPQAEVNDVRKSQVVRDILDGVPVPSIEDETRTAAEASQ
ncbi:AAA family ATPase [Natribaculum luteum]|uniref:AAA family ATPase n=1 Tax=Natribaculum luteum TaxID=1586232 RepID=A0ABD5P115_9EURY|nr:AAA family ATPase [Natribaculum luteum]